MTDRIPPHDIDAERAVLGAILVHNTNFDTAAQIVSPILDGDGHVIGIISIGGNRAPIPLTNLPGWLLAELHPSPLASLLAHRTAYTKEKRRLIHDLASTTDFLVVPGPLPAESQESPAAHRRRWALLPLLTKASSWDAGTGADCGLGRPADADCRIGAGGSRNNMTPR